MAVSTIGSNLKEEMNYVTEEDIKLILSRYSSGNKEVNIENYYVHNASNKMLGFLAEYLKIKVHLKNRQVLHFFVKAISRTNIAKAEMVKEMHLFEKEVLFYSKLKKSIDLPDVKPWSPRYITTLSDAVVFEDLNALQYKLKDKFDRFDMAHTLQALKTLARFHASSIIFEENKNKEMFGLYKITDDFAHMMHRGGYDISSEWYIQCMKGALDAMKSFSKYDESELNMIESHWQDIWSTALDINDWSPKQTKVICHRDLWNNNLMFHYKDDNKLVPDDCLFVDFQATRYQAPASDVMVLLCCNLDPKFRMDNLPIFLDCYYEELRNILSIYNIKINEFMTKEDLVSSAAEQTLWGLVICACLIPQFWIDDDLTTRIFSDNVQFDEILCKDKGLFIKKLMQSNLDYRQKVMEIFEEIADRYCFNPTALRNYRK